MAYIWTKIADAGAVFNTNQGDFYRFGDSVDSPTVTAISTSSALATAPWMLNTGYFSVLTGSINTNDPAAAVYVRSTVADGLTEKTKAFAVGVMSTINSIITKINSLTGRVTAVETLAASKAAIDDTALSSTTTTLSASKIAALNAGVLTDANAFASNAANEAKNAAIAQLSGVDSTQLDALNALSAALAANDAADGVIANTLLGKVGFTEAQNLTDAQAAQARSNIKFDSAVNAALLATVGDITTFDPDAILATALTLN